MSESIYLNGSEDVLRASHNMGEAARQMSQAANLMYETMLRLETIMGQASALFQPSEVAR